MPYQAIHNYSPTVLTEGRIVLQAGDILDIKVYDPQGWVQGYNCRSRETGYFPGKYDSMRINYSNI